MILYKFEDGKTVEVNDFDVPESMNKMFKVNLPDCLDTYISGNGEGVWGCGDNNTFNAWNNDIKDGVYFVKILNDSVYYPKLKCGTIIPVEMRGNNRPTAIFSELQSKYGVSHRDEAIKKVIEYHKGG